MEFHETFEGTILRQGVWKRSIEWHRTFHLKNLPWNTMVFLPLISYPGMHHARDVMHVGIANPRWRGKRSRHSRCMRNPQFYVSGKRPNGLWKYTGKTDMCQTTTKHNKAQAVRMDIGTYRKVSNIRRTKCQNLNDSRLVLQLSIPNPLKPSVKSIMKM